MFALAAVGFAAAGMAQEFVPTDKYSVATNRMFDNIFVSVGGHVTSTYSSPERSGMGFFQARRVQPGFNVAVGKWFTPGFGLRTKFEGIWGTRFNDYQDHRTYKMWNIHEDLLFNLSNQICGYNEKRVWNFIPYLGIGVVRNMTNNQYEISYHAGLLNNFRVSKRVTIFFEVFANAAEGSIDGFWKAKQQGQVTGSVTADNWATYKKTRSRHWDKNLGAALGLTFNIGKHTGWDKVPDVDALMADYNAQIKDLKGKISGLEDDKARLEELLRKARENQNNNNQGGDIVINNNDNQTQVQTVYVGKPTPVSVFFNIGSSKVVSRRDLVNVQALVDYAKKENKGLIVTGYADSATGNANINNRLSQQRADAVANELVNMGVSRSNITTRAKGGVDELTPPAYNRRAVVEVAE